MFAKTKIAVFALTLGMLASTTTQAADRSVESYVTTFVNQAMVVAKQELQNNVRESVINSAQKINFNGVKTIKTQVTITDIKTNKDQVKKANNS